LNLEGERKIAEEKSLLIYQKKRKKKERHCYFVKRIKGIC